MSDNKRAQRKPENRSSLPRRDFLKHSVTAAGALAVAGCGSNPPAAEIVRTKPLGANDRISIGIIGCGGRGSALMGQIQKLANDHNVDITAVCDVWKVNLDGAADSVRKDSGKEPRQSTRFQDILAMPDVHAVVIATPDFGHTPIMIQALRNGKDVYVEKPMAMDVRLADEALRLARAGKRVVQVGTQRRSEGRYKAVRDTVGEGTLGHVSRITANVGVNHARWLRDYKNCKEQDVDWEAYLFNRPKVAFDPRLLRRWHLFKMCTNGLSGLWMSHFADAVNIIMNSKYPRAATALGGTYVWHEDRQHCDTYQSIIDYPEDFLFCWSMTLANSAHNHFLVQGKNATLDVNAMKLLPSGGPRDKQIDQMKIADAPPNEDHMANWLKCIRSRQRPNADIEYGHQHSVATIMAAEALHTGRRQAYNSENNRMYPA